MNKSGLEARKVGWGGGQGHVPKSRFPADTPYCSESGVLSIPLHLSTGVIATREFTLY